MPVGAGVLGSRHRASGFRTRNDVPVDQQFGGVLPEALRDRKRWTTNQDLSASRLADGSLLADGVPAHGTPASTLTGIGMVFLSRLAGLTRQTRDGRTRHYRVRPSGMS